MQKNMEDTYENDTNYGTSDLSLAAYLVLQGFQIVRLQEIRPRQYMFILEKTEELVEEIELYWSDSSRIEPKKYNDTMRSLKTRMNDFERNKKNNY